MKSLSVCVFWPTWSWIDSSHLRWLFASYGAHLSTRDSIKTRDLINSPWYQQRWGNNFQITKSTEENIINSRKGFRIATSTGGVGTGERVHINVNDDLLRAQDAYSAANKKAAIAHMEAMSTRGVDPATYKQVIIMQRLSEDDPTEWALKRGGWEHLMLPMEYEPGRKCKTKIGFEDPRTVEGELLWPEHFPFEVVRNMEIDLNTYGAAAQLQQRPAPLGGGIIKSKWFGRYKVLPKLQYRMMFADTAMKTKEYNDYSVFEEWGLGVDNNLYLVDMVRGKWEAPELRRTAIDFWGLAMSRDEATHGKIRKLMIEDASSGTGLIQDLKRKEKIPVGEITRATDKLTRVMDVVSYIESGYVFLPEEAPYVSELTRECDAFTGDNTHAHDDQIDPMADAINEMLARRKPRRFMDL